MRVMTLTLADVLAAQKTIAGIATDTPLVPSPFLSDKSGTEFLLKLAVLHRHGRDATALVDAQRRELAPIVAALRAEQDRAGRAGDGADEFDRMLAAWRRTSAEAVLAFLDEL